MTHDLTTNPGIDYGLGQTNRDTRTDIRFGVISAHCIPFASDMFDPDYGDPTCPRCGNPAVSPDHADVPDLDADLESLGWIEEPHECSDYACLSCQRIFGPESAYGDEPIGYTCNDPTYAAEGGSDGDIFITRSPFYTWAQYCSPCAPGAGHLENPTPPNVGAKTYCFGPDVFEPDPCPYPVWRVADDVRITE